MELTTTERELWDKFRKIVCDELDKQFSNSTITDPWIMESMINTSIDLYAYTYSKLPYNGINSNRIEEIIAGEAYLLKKKFKSLIYE